MIAEILFPVALDKTFFYKISDDIKSKIQPGVRVYASFGSREKVLGYVLSIKDEKDIANSIKPDLEIKSISKVIDLKPIFDAEKFISISTFISKRWLSPLGLVLLDFLRFIPLKLDYEDISQKENSNSFKPYFFLNFKAGEIRNKILEFADKNTVVVFFPNILSLEIFESEIAIARERYKKYSSNEKDSERKLVSKLLYLGKINILLTTKAGCFLPFPDNTVFVVIDPLNLMYKQFDQHPYYDTVEVLLKISEIFNYKIFFFSNFLPLSFVDKQRSGLIETESKPFKLKEFEVKDIKKENILSQQWILEIKKLIEQNKKILIISYSRYSSSLSVCPECGWIKKCQRCNSVMKAEMMEGKKRYFCQYCGFNEDYTNICPKCNITLSEKGFGTKRIYENLVSVFYDKKIVEIDGRSVYIKSELNRAIEEIKQKDFDILIATESVISSIVDIEFDYIIFMVYERNNDYDYSYSERFIDKFLNLMLKTKDDSKILIYTYNPESYIFEKIKDPLNIIDEELELRKTFNYPPFAYVYQIEMFFKDKKKFKELVNDFIEKIDDKFKEDNDIIEYYPNLRIRKSRTSPLYTHKAWVKLKKYENFFDFLREYSQKTGVKINVIEY
ncbi:MAG: hypothetical protein K6357_03855 [Elusimicrobiota bacterium]